MESHFADGSPASLLLLSTLFLLASGPFHQTAALSLRQTTSPGCMPTSSSALSKTQGKMSGPYHLLWRGGSYRVASFTPKVVLVCMRNWDSWDGEGIRRDFTTVTVRGVLEISSKTQGLVNIYPHSFVFLLFALLLTYLYCAYRSCDVCLFSGINYLDTSHLLTWSWDVSISTHSFIPLYSYII